MKVKKSTNNSNKKSKKTKEVKESSKAVKLHVNIDNFKLLKLIGSGAQGFVYMAEKIDGPDAGNIYAIKIYSKEILLDNTSLKDLVRNERKILEQVHNSSFITTMEYAFQSAKYLYIVLKFEQGGDMFQLLQSRLLSSYETRFFIAEIVLALEELHKLNILYRDLKPENVLFDEQGHVIITDFGLSLDLSKHNHKEVGRIGGTLQYLPPETYDKTMPYGFAVDWWAVGILTHEAFTGKIPYSNFDEKQHPHDEKLMSEMFKNLKVSIDDSIDDDDVRDFITKLLTKDVEKRLGSHDGAIELKNHPFFKHIDFDLMAAKQFKPPIVNNYQDKYDTKRFNTEFTEEPITFADNSTKNYKSKTYHRFSYIAPALKSKYNNELPIEKADTNNMDMNQKSATVEPSELMKKLMPIKKEQAMPRFGIKRIGNRTVLNYIPNNERPSWIIERHDYKK